MREGQWPLNIISPELAEERSKAMNEVYTIMYQDHITDSDVVKAWRILKRLQLKTVKTPKEIRQAQQELEAEWRDSPQWL